MSESLLSAKSSDVQRIARRFKRPGGRLWLRPTALPYLAGF